MKKIKSPSVLLVGNGFGGRTCSKFKRSNIFYLNLRVNLQQLLHLIRDSVHWTNLFIWCILLVILTIILNIVMADINTDFSYHHYNYHNLRHIRRYFLHLLPPVRQGVDCIIRYFDARMQTIN